MPAAAVATKRSGADTKGAGKAMTDTERKLRNLGLVLPEDFVLHLPLRYEDETRVIPISQLRPGFAGQVRRDHQIRSALPAASPAHRHLGGRQRRTAIALVEFLSQPAKAGHCRQAAARARRSARRPVRTRDGASAPDQCRRAAAHRPDAGLSQYRGPAAADAAARHRPGARPRRPVRYPAAASAGALRPAAVRAGDPRAAHAGAGRIRSGAAGPGASGLASHQIR